MNNTTNTTNTTENSNDKKKQDKDYSYTKLTQKYIIGNAPKPVSFITAQGTISYNDIPLNYNYGTDDNRIIDDFYIEGPVVTSRGIITKEEPKTGSNGRPDYIKVSNSMMFIFDLQDPDCVEFISKNAEVHAKACHILADNGGKVGVYDFDPTRPGGMFKNPMYFKRDQVTGKIMEGRNPSMFGKMNNRNNYKTLFTDPFGNIIDWNILTDVELKLIPLFQYEKIYVASSGKSSLQVKLISAIIVDIKKINSETKQKSSSALEKYMDSNKGLGDLVSSQIAQITMDKQDNLEVDDSSLHQLPIEQQNEFADFLEGSSMNQGFQQAQAQAQAQVQVQSKEPSDTQFGTPLTTNYQVPSKQISDPQSVNIQPMSIS